MRVDNTLVPYDSIVSFGGYNVGNPVTGSFCAPNAYNFASNGCTQATEASAQWIAPSAGTLSGLRVRLDSAVGAARSETYTVRNSTRKRCAAGANATVLCTNDTECPSSSCTNNSDLTVTISAAGLEGGATTCTTNCTYAAGDQLTVAFTRVGTGELKARNIVVTSDGTGQIIATQNAGGTLVSTAYVGWHSAFGNTNPAMVWPLPNGGLVKNLRASLPATAANSATFKVCSGAAGTTPLCTGTRPTCTITAGSLTCSDTTTTLTLGAGDVTNIQMTVTGSLGTIAAAVAFEIGDVPVATPTPTSTLAAPTVTVTPTPVATITTVATPTVPAATLTATGTLTPTPVVTVTATPLPPTPTPTPLATATATSLQATPTPTALASPTVPAPTWTVTPTPTGTATSAGLTPTPTPTVTNGACVLQPKQLRTKQLGTALTAKGLCP